MHNNTHVHLPQPTSHMRFDVQQCPGQSYPASPHRAWVNENTYHVAPTMHQPCGDTYHCVP
jgi:hypothetical protein